MALAGHGPGGTMISLHAGSALTAAFLASLVEAAEAMTIVLAVAVVRGWWRVSKSFSFWLRSDAGHDVLLPVSAAAFAACLLVASSGIFLHRPLARAGERIEIRGRGDALSLSACSGPEVRHRLAGRGSRDPRVYRTVPWHRARFGDLTQQA